MERELVHNSNLYLNMIGGVNGLFFVLTMYSQGNEDINKLIKDLQNG